MFEKTKAIFIDSEGTLRDEKHVIKEGIVETITDLERKGIYTIITSGLPRFLVRNIQRKAQTSNYVICSNGADVYDIKGDKKIFAKYLNQDFIYDLWKEYQNTFTFILGKGDVELSSDESDYTKNPIMLNSQNIYDDFYQCHISQKKIKLGDNISNELKCLKKNTQIDFEKLLGKEMYYHLCVSDLTSREIAILVRLKRFLELQALQKKLIEEYSKTISVANQSKDFEKFQFDGEIPWFSINNVEVSKGNGIIEMCKYLNISQEETMSIGNDYNDRTIMEVSNVFVCPSNSCQEILQKSDYVYNEKDGLNKVLKKVGMKNG